MSKILQDPTTGDVVGRTVIYDLDPNGNPVRLAAAAAATNVLDGYQTFTATTAATTVITVPAGRTWVGTIGASVACQEVAAGVVAGQARAVFTTAGANATPAAGTIAAVEAKCGANAAAGTVGSEGNNTMPPTPLTVIAPAGNTVTVQVAATIAGTAGVVDAWASGQLF